MNIKGKKIILLASVIMTSLSAAAAESDITQPAGCDCFLCELAGKVKIFELETTINELSGAETINLSGSSARIMTRYTYSDQKYLALEYLKGKAAGYGYETEVQSFVEKIFSEDLLGLAASDTKDTIWAGTVDGRFYRSVYQGGWTGFRRCAFIDSIEIYSLEKGPGGGLWAGCGFQRKPQGGLYYSDDGGLNWEKRKSGINVYSVKSISFADDRSGIAVGQTGTLLLTGDGGSSWSVENPSVFVWKDLNDSAWDGSEYWIAAEGGRLYRSGDWGTSWEESVFTNPSLNSISFSDSLHGVIAADGSVFYTSNGGANWDETVLGVNLTAVDMADSSVAAACAEEGDIYLTGDGGVSWRKVPVEYSGIEEKSNLLFLREDLFLSVGEDTARSISIEDGSSYSSSAEVAADSAIGKNLIFRKEGFDLSEERVVLCAHYDSYNWKDPYNIAPGADDNASGVAGVLECARVLANAMTDRTIEFVLFDGEEEGLLGSGYFVENIDPQAVYRAVFNLDMLGKDYSSDGQAVCVAGREEKQDSLLFSRYSDLAGFLGLNIIPEYISPSPASDHQSFWKLEDLPAVLLVEGGYRDNPYMHLEEDRAEHIDFEYLRECVQLSLTVLALESGYIGERPEETFLCQNFPNPFFGKTKIIFELPRLLPVTLTVYDVSGRRVVDLIDKDLGPGKIDSYWDGKNNRGVEVASGVYFLRMRAGSYKHTRKMIYLK
ncbi:MAG: M20/M25/M40 family metallo-hydrolase [Candidatus Krumholzibacteriota bacterium]|nr:M20/M25/M40 family metallo-hydrolase [Candidatus Krumholzibacteriota bacterium]